MAGTMQDPVVTEVVEVDMSEEEAIALALSMCGPGESISIHDKTCTIEYGTCTCAPAVMIVGASANA